MLAPVLVLLHYYRGQFIGKKMSPLILYFLISLGFGLLALKAQGTALEVVNLEWLDRIIVPFIGVGAYVSKLFVPIRMSALHPYPEGLEWTGLHYVYLIFGMATLGDNYLGICNQEKQVSFWIGLFWIGTSSGITICSGGI